MYTFILATPQILEPLLLFCRNALRIHDTRCCALTIRCLRNSIPSLRPQGAAVRAFLCHEVLQSAITSLHDPYFVDVQKDLAALIAQIVVLDDPRPRELILCLPGLADQPDRVDRYIAKLRSCASEKQARSLVLDLLSSVRGVSIHELGRMERVVRKRTKMQEQYMTEVERTGIVRGGSPELAGVADMFG